MKRETAEFIEEAAYNSDIMNVSIYEGYSGRGMMGKETYGVVCENPLKLLAACVSEAAYRDEDELDQAILTDIMKVRTDNLGLNTILY